MAAKFQGTPLKFKGELKWAQVWTPDSEYDKFSTMVLVGDKLEFKWNNGSLVKDLSALEDIFQDMMREHWEAVVAESTTPKKLQKQFADGKIEFLSPIKPELDKEGEETGELYMKPSRKATIFSKKQNKEYKQHVSVLSRDGRPLEHGTSIGNGSLAVVDVTARPYFRPETNGGCVGISLELRGVMMLKLVEYTGGSSFEDVEEFVDEDEMEAMSDEPTDIPEVDEAPAKKPTAKKPAAKKPVAKKAPEPEEEEEPEDEEDSEVPF